MNFAIKQHQCSPFFLEKKTFAKSLMQYYPGRPTVVCYRICNVKMKENKTIKSVRPVNNWNLSNRMQVSVLVTKSKVQLRYQYRSWNFFATLNFFLFFFSLLGEYIFWKPWNWIQIFTTNLKISKKLLLQRKKIPNTIL